MKVRIANHKLERDGSAMILALIFVTVTLIIMAGTLGWTTTSSRLTGRNVEYFRTESAAEAATEKVVAHIANDYHEQGDWFVLANLDNYRRLVPLSGESTAWRNYQFTDIQGNPDRISVEFMPPSAYKVLSSQFQGLSGYASTYRIVSNARQLDGPFNILGGVLQDVDVATIPLFQFAIFYNLELEIEPGPDMTVTGPVYCNTNIYLQPINALTFQSDVRSAGYIKMSRKPGDTRAPTSGTVDFTGHLHDDRQSSLNLPIGTNSTPAAVREIVEVPPVSESASSPLGKERFYNKADMVITVTTNGVLATSGLWNNFTNVVPSNQVVRFVSTTNSFRDQRENTVMKITQIDIANLKSWDATNYFGGAAVHPVRVIFVVDKRLNSAVRLVNGQNMLTNGLTIASPNPVYIKGHYNAPVGAVGTANTSATFPAAVISDAVTVLSGSWNDANSASGLGSRVASDTTVNAAFLAGIVPTIPGQYSGGVENFPRFLEDWGGRTFTYNGSMVVLYESKQAKSPWPSTGAVYNPPTRKWSFDQNFRDVNKLPPGTPCARAMSRGRWAMIKPGTSS